jgi:polysaccharide deacetylase 2 family uncharacterized protein YibQ
VPRLLIHLFILFAFPCIATPAQVAIIIDDIGYRKSDVQSLYLPGNISYAVLPHTPYGKMLALQAKAKNNDVILHIPMEASNGKKLGPGALTSEMNEDKIRYTLKNAFAEVPFALGINNHMGSKLTQLYDPMAWTMQFLKERNLIFVDSMTTHKSQAESVAKRFGVPSLHRHIFLDNELTHEYISKQFMQLIKDAQTYNSVVAIAHPHPQTVDSLVKLLPLLAQYNIELVPISSLLPNNFSVESLALTSD